MFRRLEVALAIDTHRNFRRAALALGITQPGLTRSLHVLEGELGVRLFDRAGGECAPTSFGRAFLVRARRIAAELAETRREIALLQGLQAGDFTIGMGAASIQDWIGRAIGRLSAANPGLHVRVVEHPWMRLADALISGQVDVAVGEPGNLDANPDIVVSRLPRRTVVVVCRAGHPLASLEKVGIAELARFPLASPRLPQRFGAHLPARSALGSSAPDSGYFMPAILCSAWTTAREVVRNSDALAVCVRGALKDPAARSGLAILGFAAPWMHSASALMWRSDRMLHPALKTFRDIARGCEAEFMADENRRDEP